MADAAPVLRSAAAVLRELRLDACDVEDTRAGAIGRRCPRLRLL
jgi:hypothetical protein